MGNRLSFRGFHRRLQGKEQEPQTNPTYFVMGKNGLIQKTKEELQEEYEASPYWVRKMVSLEGFIQLRGTFKV